MIKRHRFAASVSMAIALLSSACGSGQGAPAVWAVDPANPTAESSQSFTALVMRVGCAGGRTGEVFEPTIRANDDEIIITFTVAPISGTQTCPSNDVVPVVVELGDPIGDRRLVDGACRSGQAPAGGCDPTDPSWLPDP